LGGKLVEAAGFQLPISPLFPAQPKDSARARLGFSVLDEDAINLFFSED
jgi:hypothetical protein